MDYPDLGPYLEVDRAYHDKQLLFFKNHPYPFKGIATQEAINAVDLAKKILRLIIKRPYRALDNEYIERCYTILEPHLVTLDALCPSAREIFCMIMRSKQDFRLAVMISHILHYDAAYRFRLQDLASETTKEALIKNPRKELKRLLALNLEREAPAFKNVAAKIKSLGNLISLALLWPPLKRKFREALEQSTFSNTQLDEGDRYWCSMRRDYAFGGRRTG